ncbi:MAG TPA: CorA family divalent cation transporter [Candidatus Saccharimonadales bacterium]|nr:CorA family divalent cation transporter [Candidatus Saccharimonadales bacterium]
MLRYYVRRSGVEDFQKVTTPPNDNVWIHGDRVSEVDLETLADHYHMDLNILRDVLDENELPRIEMRDDALYVFVRTVQHGKHGRIYTTPVLMVLKDSVLANLSTSLADDQGLATPSMIAHTSDTTGLLLGTFAMVINEYEQLMQHTARHIKDTGKRLRNHEVTNEDFIKFVTVEDNLNEYHMNLSSMLVVAQRLEEILQDSDDAEAIEDILLYIRQLLVAIESHNQSIVSIRNAYSTIANNVLNQRMKTLTMLTLLIALPNVFYGMYGMNVDLPFQDEPWLYGVIVLFTFMLIFVVYWLAKRLRIF